MNKLLIRWFVFSTFMVVICAVVAHNWLRAKPMAEPASGADPHMSMTKLRPPQPGDKARADVIVAAAKKAAERYRDYRKAEADGYPIFIPDHHHTSPHFTLHPPPQQH